MNLPEQPRPDFNSSTTLVLRDVFKRLAPEDVHQLRQVATQRTYPPDTVLCHEGQREDTLYVVQSGLAKITQHVPDADDRMLALRGPGEFFGEMALIDDAPRSASVITVQTTDVIEITKQGFNQVLAHSPSLAMLLLRHAHNVLRTSMQQQINELHEKNIALETAYRDLQAAQAQLLADERMKRDLELAAQVQRSILPESLPQRPGLAFAARAQPAREMGGDFYDVFELDGHHLGLLIADVSDKSIPAAMFMAISRSLFLTEARRTFSPCEVVLAVNDLLLEISSSDDMFVTAFYGVLHVDERRLTYVRAGHDRPLLLRADGSVEALDSAGRFLGMLEGLSVEERTINLHQGDRLIMYSDGVPDATNRQGESYGAGRLQTFAGQRYRLDAHRLLAEIFDDVLAFQGDAPQFDDITLLVTAID